jgi:hypothetical protein
MRNCSRTSNDDDVEIISFKEIMIALGFCVVFVAAAIAGPAVKVLMFEDPAQMVIGTVQGFDRNTLEILDENDGLHKRLVYLGPSTSFQKGDRVRAYYEPDSNRITIIKKMTSLEYSKDQQNLGYVLKTP